MNSSRAIVLACLFSLIAVGVSGCGTPRSARTGSFYADLQSPDPIVVLNASIRVGQQQDYNSTEYLIDNLRDDNFTVRHAAHMALLMLYHGLPFEFDGLPPRPFGYDAVEPHTREGAVQAWEKWWVHKRAELIRAAEKAEKEKAKEA